MSWLYILGFVVIVVGLVAVTGSQPKGGRPASNTRLMTAARVMLAIVAIVIAVVYFFEM